MQQDYRIQNWTPVGKPKIIALGTNFTFLIRQPQYEIVKILIPYRKPLWLEH